MRLAKDIIVLFSGILFWQSGSQAIRQSGKPVGWQVNQLDCPMAGFQRVLLYLLAFILLLLSPIKVWSYHPYHPGGVSMGASHCPTRNHRPSAEEIKRDCDEIEEEIEELAEGISEGLTKSLDERFMEAEASTCPAGQVPGEPKSIDDLLLDGEQLCCKNQTSGSVYNRIFPTFAHIFVSYALADPTGAVGGRPVPASNPRCQRCLEALRQGRRSAINACNAAFGTSSSSNWPCTLTSRPGPVGPTVPPIPSRPGPVGPTVPPVRSRPGPVGPAVPPIPSRPGPVGPTVPPIPSRPGPVGPAVPPIPSRPGPVGPAVPPIPSRPGPVGPDSTTNTLSTWASRANSTTNTLSTWAYRADSTTNTLSTGASRADSTTNTLSTWANTRPYFISRGKKKHYK